jgi:hypothetical protein
MNPFTKTSISGSTRGADSGHGFHNRDTVRGDQGPDGSGMAAE